MSREDVNPWSLEVASANRNALGLLSLSELSTELSARTDIFDVGNMALFNLMGHFSCSRGAFWAFPEDDTKDAVLIRAQGLPEPPLSHLGAIWARWLVRLPDGFTAPVLVSDLETEQSVPELELVRQTKIALFAPISIHGRLRAVVALGEPVSDVEFGLAERELLQTSLNIIGVAVENISLYNRSVEHNRKLQRANDQLHEMDALKQEFFSNLNHEFRTPLTIMTAYLEMLASGESDTVKSEQLNVVRQQADVIQSMMMKLLDLSELKGGELEVRLDRSDVGPLLMEYCEGRRPGVSSDLRDLHASVASELPAALCDPARVLQIVDALVDNAVKFCPRGTRIVLRADADTHAGNEWVRIDAQDDGPGIPPERLPFIFDSFRQGDGSITREQGGMGIGLSLARKLADKMGGSLTVASEMGKGTTFSLRLPTG